MRAASTVATTGILLLGAGITAHADTSSHTIEFGTPEQVTSTTESSTSALPEATVDCGIGTTVHNRVTSCSNYRVPVQFFVNEQPYGTATLYTKATAQLDPRNRYEWHQKVELRLVDPSVPEAWLVSATVSLDCNYCSATPGGTKVLIPYTTQTFDITVSSPGRDLVNDSIRPRGTFTAPRFDQGAAYLGDVFRPRCDNTPRVTPRTTGGCVYPDVPPIWQIDVTNPRVDAVGWHVLWAQNNLQHPWGKPRAGWDLHRTFDQTLIGANRGVACGPDVPRPPGRPDLSCDEYPFAQSTEGASRNPDYSCHFLDRNDNSREGSLRKAFLNSLRTLEGDAFQVDVINVPADRQAPPDVTPRGPVGCGHD